MVPTIFAKKIAVKKAVIKNLYLILQKFLRQTLLAALLTAVFTVHLTDYFYSALKNRVSSGPGLSRPRTSLVPVFSCRKTLFK